MEVALNTKNDIRSKKVKISMRKIVKFSVFLKKGVKKYPQFELAIVSSIFIAQGAVFGYN